MMMQYPVEGIVQGVDLGGMKADGHYVLFVAVCGVLNTNIKY
jgi:hypothetical protein